MNLEELEKQLENEEKEGQVEASNNTNEAFKNLSPEKQAQVMAIINSSNSQEETSKEEIKEVSNDYKDNFVMPKEDKEEVIGFDFDKKTREYEESWKKQNQEPTELSMLYDSAYDSISEELDLGIKYRGRVIDVKTDYSNYETVLVNYEVYDNGNIRHVTDKYTFGGDYDKWNMERLVIFLTSIENFYKNDFNPYNVETMAESMKFLIGADVILVQYQNDKGYRRNQVSVLGIFDRDNRRMVAK